MYVHIHPLAICENLLSPPGRKETCASPLGPLHSTQKFRFVAIARVSPQPALHVYTHEVRLSARLSLFHFRATDPLEYCPPAPLNTVYRRRSSVVARFSQGSAGQGRRKPSSATAGTKTIRRASDPRAAAPCIMGMGKGARVHGDSSVLAPGGDAPSAQARAVSHQVRVMADVEVSWSVRNVSDKQKS